MKKLPKTLYVYKENDGTEDEFLSTHEELDTIAVETGKRVRVGVYTLEKQVEVVTETNIVAEVG